MRDEIYLLDYLVVLAKNKRLIFRVAMVCAVVTAGFSLFLPNLYTGQAKLLLPQRRESQVAMMLGQITGQLGGLAGLASQGLGFENPSQVYVDMLQSRTVADGLIGRFDLMKRYKVERMTDAREILDGNSTIKADEQGVITIEVTDKDPAFAAALTNGYVGELTNLSKTLAVTDAAQQRLYYEQELQKTRKDLVAAEEAMAQTQQKTGIIHLESQARALIENAAMVRAEIVAKRVELQSLRTFATEQNPWVIRAKQELGALESALAKMQGAQGGSPGELEPPAGVVPAKAMEYGRRLRDLKFSETLYGLLASQYEAAKLDEGRDSTLIQVLDKAVPPEKKSGPKRGLMVLVALVLGTFGAVTFVLVREGNERAKADPEHSAKLELLKIHLRPQRPLWRWIRRG